MSNNKIQRAYVSEIDQFLQQLDQKYPKKSKSQQKEITKYQRIYRLRDEAASETNHKQDLWDEF